MKIEENENLLRISDKPYLRWVIGSVIFLFSILLASIAISLLFRVNDIAVNLGILATSFILGAIGFRLIWKYPQTICEFDTNAGTLIYSTFSIFGRTKQIIQIAKIKQVEITEKFAWTRLEQDKSRVELVLPNKLRLPVSSRWRLNGQFCQTVADKLNSTVRRLNKN